MNLMDLEGVGPVRLEALRAAGIFSLRDLLFTLPVRYEDHHTIFPCAAKEAGQVLVSGQFREPLKCSYFHGISRVSGTVHDSSGKLSVCWFNQPWIAKQIQPDVPVRLYGRLSIKDGRRMLQNPSVINDDGLIPVYKPIHRFPAKSFRKLVSEALEHLEDCCPETLPASFRISNRLCELNFALREAHFPSNPENLRIARRRLTYEKFLLYLLYVSFSGKTRNKAHAFNIQDHLEDQFWSLFSFDPTGDQRKVLHEIADDLKTDRAMARLVQGDVGCGKTAVAFGAVFLAASAGFQSAMMAPTEILAVQHYENAVKTLVPLGISCEILTGNTKTRERNRILEAVRDGSCKALFGTHALIGKNVQFANLGLAVTDEQHRFGVRQRSMLQEKGESLSPHVLVMSATPIPRSMALILYGDLDLSVIHELPPGRKPVQTRIVPENKREDMYRYILREVQKGMQAYIVCPMVEDSDLADELKSAKSLYAELQNGILRDVRIGLTWGDQKNTEKENVLRAFYEGSYDILVSTTVIEVGINNPNATIMIIENAERFGLSQLHQLRGRVGRGSAESWCFLLSGHSEKLGILCQTNDGFEISRKDLEMRGPGDLMGTRQAGEAGLPVSAGDDPRLLDEVSEAVRMLHRNPEHAETLRFLEEYALRHFQESGKTVALN